MFGFQKFDIIILWFLLMKTNGCHPPKQVSTPTMVFANVMNVSVNSHTCKLCTHPNFYTYIYIVNLYIFVLELHEAKVTICQVHLHGPM
jgi:hypothetical protein